MSEILASGPSCLRTLSAPPPLTQQLGDEAAMDVVHLHDTIVRKALADLDGREVKHTGDGIMASFVSAAAAIKCATRIERDLAKHKQAQSDCPLQIRIGIASGRTR